MDALIGPDVDLALLLLRVLVGVTFSLHGFQKLLGWFGGGGLDGTAAWFRGLGFGDGRSAAVLAGTGEVAGGLGLALGLLTPLSAMAVVGTMTTAALVNRAEAGFWSVNKGWELNGYLIVVAATLAVAGPGAYSLDHLLGLQRWVGPLPGGAAVLAGVLGGWARWATRRPPTG
ncbi:MAG: DoxX family protein [Nitriliruptoraceae bacterium]